MIRPFVSVAMLAAVLANGANAEACAPNAVDLRGDWGQAHFNVEIADDAAEQAKGLMFRESLPVSSGMLFIYDTPRHARFWMKNTLIPLDMLFLDKTGQVLRIAHNTRPLDETPIDGGENVLMILEINGGLAKAMGISIGSQLRHPRFETAIALWSCAVD